MSFKRIRWGAGVWMGLLLVLLAGCRREAVEVPQWTSDGTADAGVAVETADEVPFLAVVVVHVCGEVASPGVYELPEGSRLQDAVLAAGGMTEAAARDYLNLAKILADGEKVVVPNREEVKDTPLGTNAVSEDSEKVNLNTADVKQLVELPGIGEAKAEAIVAYREEHGVFSTAEELMEVPGIGPAVFEQLKNHIMI